MSIDWFTLVAQLINFFVLVGLLRWFLYTPVLRAMKIREQHIADRLKDAEDSQRHAGELAEQLELKRRSLEEQQEEMIEAAKQKAHEVHQALVVESRESVAENRRAWFDALQREKELEAREIRREVGKMAEAATRRSLKDLANEGLEEQIQNEFIRRFRELDGSALDEIRSHLSQKKSAKLEIHSAFEIPPSSRNRIQTVLVEKLGTESSVEFVQSQDLVCGIELDLDGYHFGWNIKDYLNELMEHYLAKTKSRA